MKTNTETLTYLDGDKVAISADYMKEYMTNLSKDSDLPELPYTNYNGYSDGSEPLYTADQMRDYARKAIAAQTAQAVPSAEAIRIAIAILETTRRSPDQQEALDVLKSISWQPFAWFTDDHLTDKSATTYDSAVRDRWIAKGWSVHPLYAAPPTQAIAVEVVTDLPIDLIRTFHDAAEAKVAELAGDKSYAEQCAVRDAYFAGGEHVRRYFAAPSQGAKQ